jgi:tetratricopeptide (TPR) repeat protein
MRRFEEAESTYREAISIGDEANTDAFGRTYAVLGLANVNRKSGRIAEAETLTREAWEARKEIVGEGHSAELHTRITLASILAETGRYDEARPLLDAAIEDSRAGGAVTRNRLDIALEERAITARDSGEPDSIHARFLRELIELRRETLPADDPRITRLEAGLEALMKD